MMLVVSDRSPGKPCAMVQDLPGPRLIVALSLSKGNNRVGCAVTTVS